MRVLGELEGVECAGEPSLEIAQHGVDRLELPQLGRGLAAARDGPLLGMGVRFNCQQ
jgi:hypothetical protein